MTFAIAALPCPDSPLRRLDPRWKLAAIVLAVAALVCLQTVQTAAVALACAIALAAFGRVPPSWCLARLRTAIIVVAPFLVLLPFLGAHVGPMVAVGPMQLSVEGARVAALIAVKTLALVLLVLALLASAPLPETLQAAQALWIPGPLVQVAALTYRYVFVFNAELARLRIALRARGYRNRVSLHSYRTAGHVAGVLLVRGYEQGERVGHAMRCRGFNGRFHSLTEFHTRPVDVTAFVLTVGCSAAILVWDVLVRE